MCGQDVAREVAELGHVGLATVLVGDDPASHVYIAREAQGGDRGRASMLVTSACLRTRARTTSSRSSTASTPTTRSTESSSSYPYRPT